MYYFVSIRIDIFFKNKSKTKKLPQANLTCLKNLKRGNLLPVDILIDGENGKINREDIVEKIMNLNKANSLFNECFSTRNIFITTNAFRKK